MLRVKFTQSHPKIQWQFVSPSSLTPRLGSNAAGSQSFIIELAYKSTSNVRQLVQINMAFQITSPFFS